MRGTCIIEVAPISGCAVIIDQDGNMYTFRPGEGVQDLGKTNIGMFLQPALSAQIGVPIETWEIMDEYPFKEIERKITERVGIHDALRKFLSSLDKDLTPETRKMCARGAEKAFENDLVYKSLRKALMDNPMPPEV